MTAADQSVFFIEPAREPARQHLLQRIHRSYVTTTHSVQIAGQLLPFTRVADPDLVLDEIAARADLQERLSGKREGDEQLHLPYWAELWDSAMGIAQYLVRNWDLERRGRGDAGKRGHGETGFAETSENDPSISASPPLRVSVSPLGSVSESALSALDLGCGMGLSGTVAAMLGAKVLFADIEPPALLFARLNSLPWADRVRTRKLDWRADRLGEQFDLIIGADILYERSQWEYQEPFLSQHLAPGGTVLLGEPGRQTGDLFIEWIRERFWSLEILLETVPTRKTPVRILRLTRR